MLEGGKKNLPNRGGIKKEAEQEKKNYSSSSNRREKENASL